MVFGLESSGYVYPGCEYCLSKMEDFDIFIRYLSISYKKFCFNQILRLKITKLYPEFKKQWDSILVALELDYKLGLAKILDENDAPDCLKGFIKEGNTEGTDIWKIKNWRNDFLVHFNERTLRDWGKFREKNYLDDRSIKFLFSKIFEIAEQYNRGKYSPNLKESFQQIEKDISIESDKWLSNFKEV